MGERTCLGCKAAKPLTEFGTRYGQPRPRCKVCMRAANHERYVRLGGVDRVRRANLARYGLTPEDFAQMLEAQRGVCAICGNPQSTRNKSLCVDHDHATNTVRDLLCDPCNLVIGFLEKNPVDPHLFVAYLDKHRTANLEA